MTVEPLALDVSIASSRWRAALPRAKAIARQAAAAAFAASPAGLGRYEASLMLTDDERIRVLNRAWRGKDAATDVLAFPANAVPVGASDAPPTPLGDIVVAFETASTDATAENKALADHLSHLVVHGMLHLLGFDHHTYADAAVMERLEIRVLNGLGVEDPYRGRPAA